MFKEEEAFPDNGQRQNFVFMGYPYTPPLHKDDYAKVVKELQQELPIRFWYFLDEVTTAEMIRKVWRAILRSDVSVFDISGGNPNVAFELGLAVAKDRRCITMLKTGEPNPLGSADLGYSERMEYDSGITLKARLKDFVINRSTGLRLLRELSYDLVPNDGSLTRESVEERMLTLVTKVFNSKSVKKNQVNAIMGSDTLGTATANALRAADVLKLEGVRGGAKYVFGEDWVYHDHEVTGDL